MAATTDLSRRFVLPADAPLVRNLAALWAADAKLARRIERLREPSPYTVQPSKCGTPTVAVESGAKLLYLHSRHEPVEEAARLIDGIDFTERTAFFIHGLGL